MLYFPDISIYEKLLKHLEYVSPRPGNSSRSFLESEFLSEKILPMCVMFDIYSNLFIHKFWVLKELLKSRLSQWRSSLPVSACVQIYRHLPQPLKSGCPNSGVQTHIYHFGG